MSKKYSVIHIRHGTGGSWGQSPYGGELVPLVVRTERLCNLGKPFNLRGGEIMRNYKYFGAGSVKPLEFSYFGPTMDAIQSVIGIIKGFQTQGKGVCLEGGEIAEPTSLSVVPPKGQKLLAYSLKRL